MKKIRTASLIATLLMTVYMGAAVNGGTIQASTVLSQKSFMASTLVAARNVTDDDQGVVTNVIQSIKETLSNLAGTETDHAEPIVSVPEGQAKPTQVTDVSVSENEHDEPVIVGAVETPELSERRWAWDVNAGRTEATAMIPVNFVKDHPYQFLFGMLLAGNLLAVVVYRLKKPLFAMSEQEDAD
ncbi:hypothetical protein [Weissella sp. MSCH1]|uniref:hypothetical protein n=1 Tax=Weissella sp. MSCH1 TaxID=3383343 RepID=UPI0038968B2A